MSSAGISTANGPPNKSAGLAGQALAIHCDVTDEAQIASLFAQAEQQFGTVAIAFANAGIADKQPHLRHDDPREAWNPVIALNSQGVVATCRVALKIMFAKKRGKIINAASIGGLAGAPRVVPVPACSAAKGAVVKLTCELALPDASPNLQANAICLRFFRTRLSDVAFDDNSFVATVSAFTAMGRVAAAAAIKGTALYLASDASNFTAGLMLVSDGGCMAI